MSLHNKWRCIFWTSVASLNFFFFLACLKVSGQHQLLWIKMEFFNSVIQRYFILWLWSLRCVLYCSKPLLFQATDVVLRKPPIPGIRNYGINDSALWLFIPTGHYLLCTIVHFPLKKQCSSEDPWTSWQAFPLTAAINKHCYLKEVRYAY